MYKRLFIVILLMNVFCSTSHCQQPRLVLPVGHTAAVISTYFSPDGKYVVTVSLDGTAKLWEANTGMLIKDFRISGDASIIKADAARFSADGKLLVILYEGDHFSVYRMNDGKPFEPETESSTLSHLIDPPQRTDIEHIMQMFSSDSRFFIYGWGVGDPFVFNVQTGKKVFSIKGIQKENLVSRVFFSPDNKNIFIETDLHLLYVCNVQNGAIIKKINLGSSYSDLKICDDNKTIICIPDENNENPITQLLHWTTGKFIGLKGTDAYGELQYSPNGNLLTLFSGMKSSGDEIELPTGLLEQKIYYDSITVWETGTGKQLFVKTKLSALFAAKNISIFAKSNKKLLIPASENQLNVLDGRTGNILFHFTTGEGYLQKAFFSDDEKWIITLTGKKEIGIWDAENGNLIAKPEPQADASLDCSLSFNRSKIITGGANGEPVIWDLNTKTEVSSFKSFSNSYLSARLSEDNRKLILYSDAATKTVDLISGEVSVDTATNILQDASGIQFDSSDTNGEKLISRTVYNNLLTKSASFKTSPDKQVQICNYGVNLLFLCPYGFGQSENVDDAAFAKIPRTNYSSFEIINDAQFSADSKKLIITYQNNYISVFDIYTGKYLFSYIDIDENDFLIVDTVSGFYKGTTGAARKIHYVTGNNQVITFEQLDVKYNRPDKLLESMGSHDTALIRSLRNAYEKRIKKLGIDTTSFQNGYDLPTGEIANRNQISFEQKSGNLILKIIARDKKLLLQRLNILINETPIWGIKGIDLSGIKRKYLDTTVLVSLASGENIIEVSVFNQNGIENYRVPLSVNYTPEKPIVSKVYFAGIGTNQFADSTHNLRWCVRDIRDLAAALATKFGKQFVLVDTLFNEKVNRESVQSIKKKLLQAGINDKVIISFSGHGLLSGSMDYYLSTYNVNFQKPELEGLPYELLENLLDSLSARKKLLLLDACHSGEVDKEDVNKINQSLASFLPDSLSSNSATKGGIVTNTTTGKGKLGLQSSFDLMQDLFANVGKGTGATVIAASGGVQLAQERSDLGHGVFTFSIIEALKKFSTIKISTLKKYVSDEVVKLTRGLQKPTARMEPLLADWNLW